MKRWTKQDTVFSCMVVLLLTSATFCFRKLWEEKHENKQRLIQDRMKKAMEYYELGECPECKHTVQEHRVLELWNATKERMETEMENGE